ncbi:phospholipase A2 inhibitor gamma subunit B-like [Varanus komodoensis]|uniref:Phospholipase A2 inhibitor n=1 Tax=Varanus komodoensis TaxID=61221 RepID=A0A8D2J9G6_VARKO|nr:phospholipase A2 inhibitor gamma subunit B-like [Varanus komodoensis]XP_044290878.1 phospholipase A2 inhibitor gamma subunit B-like [Varanus komodoensis]XP_044290880.1 phospholipase A2 inhibitor gamma subunit B-like [Varanus komodoensis]
MKILLGLLPCFVFIYTSASLECEVCAGVGTSCTGIMQTCEAGKDTCVIAVSESSLAGFHVQTIAKTCESSSVCRYGPQYMHFGHGQNLRARITCCVGAACRTAVPQLPPVIIKPNGKQCPSCYSLFSGTCNEEEMVDCVGPESECLDLAATVVHGTVVANTLQKGCVTKGVCSDLKVGESDIGGIRSIITSAVCKGANSTSA